MTMKVFGLAGWSGSGKTTLVTALIPELTARGYAVSTIKHAHHSFDIDRPGKDSWRHRHAGASEVLISSSERLALVREHRGAPEPTLEMLLQQLAPVDLVLIEGFKREAVPKLEIWRAETGQPPLFPDDPNIVALAGDRPDPEPALPRYALDDIAGIADFIVRRCNLPARAA